ncbi:MAG: hypothetical protein J3K34DRAFT_380094 [Monoraphidium minutum]|nr:MAG: hypothetical protein J3K34DRAFT_380094 [Monoraphidium minutum]
MLGSYFAHETGNSPGWLLRVKTNRSRTGEAAAKVWCVPLRKPGTATPPTCKPSRIRRQLQTVLAQQRVAEDCGLLDVLPAHWVGRVDGALPGSGYRIAWDGLWAELSPGASLESLVFRGAPPAVPAAVLDLLQTRLSHSDVIQAAVFDLLTSQCDRHAQNVYVSRAGRLSLIDNDQAYGSSWRPCGVDSIFLPGTQKHEIQRLGFKYVMKSPKTAPDGRPSRGASPLQLLDYRCHVPGGALGTAYPPRVAACLKNISSMTKQQVKAHYGFPLLATAAALRRRAADMSSRGFEWALQSGWPRNPVPMRYKWGAPCCKVYGQQARPDARPAYQCEDWEQAPADLPKGEPFFGGPWRERARDTGTYELGSPPRAGHFRPEGWAAGAWLGDDDEDPDPGYAPVNQSDV